MKNIKRLIKIGIFFLNEFCFHLKNKELLAVKWSKFNFINANPLKVIKIDYALKEGFKWVGAVAYQNQMYCIPNSCNEVLKLNCNTDSFQMIPFSISSQLKEYLWSGGCIYQDKIYGFPRSSNQLFCLNPQNDQVSFLNLDLNYHKEHHYSGVCTDDGIIYEPPRNYNKILVIDLKNRKTKEISISPKFLKYNYHTGILHPNGLIYFMPDKNEKVLALDPKTEKFQFIGKRVKNCLVYGPAIGKDGNIYGFSAYGKGILKIDVKHHLVEIINENQYYGCYGNQTGCNGNIYGVIGNGTSIYEFDVLNGKDSILYTDNSKLKAKCAGSIISQQGDIYTVPAYGTTVYKIIFQKKETVSTDSIFNNNY